MPLSEKSINRPLNERRSGSKSGKTPKKDLSLHRRSPARSGLKFDDENKENVPPQTSASGGFSSRPFAAGRYTPRSSEAKKESFAVTGRNLAGPPLKLLSFSNDISVEAVSGSEQGTKTDFNPQNVSFSANDTSTEAVFGSPQAPTTTAPVFVTPTLPLSLSTTPPPPLVKAVPENWTLQRQHESLYSLPTESHHLLHAESEQIGYETNYQYDGGENQVLMTDNYAESAVAFPIFVAPSVIAPLTEIPNAFAASVTVDENGFCSFQLSHDIVVNIGPNFAVQIINPQKSISLSLSGCATQMALTHPQGRVLQYNSRIEVHSRGMYVEKNAKIWPRGISFTASNCAIVYLVDQAGTRSTSDQFHDLYSEDSSESIFSMSCTMYDSWSDAPISAHERSTEILNNVSYWHTEKAHFWQINEGGIIIQQAFDGFVSVERKYGNELFTLKTSPSNGKARLQSSFIYVTASEGNESHLFVKSKDRRIHHSSKAFTVRNAGHSAGFDETGSLRIY